MNAAFPHLHPKTAEMLSSPVEARIKYMDEPKWIPYTLAVEIKTQLEWLMNLPKVPRMPCLLIHGPSNNGKTFLLESFGRSHPIDQNLDGEAIRAPLIYIEGPPKPDENYLVDCLLLETGTPFPAKAPLAIKKAQLKAVVPEIGLHLYIIDDIHDLMKGTDAKRLACLSTLKWLTNSLRISIVAVGTEEAKQTFRLDRQIATRFRKLELPRWTDTEEYRQLLANFESLLPLPKPSGLSTDRLALTILKRSRGLLGEISDLLKAASKVAILSGKDHLTPDLLSKLKWAAAEDRIE